MKNINTRSIPDDIHKAFKLYCVTKGITMEKEIVNLMEKAVKEHDKESMELRSDKGKA